MPPKVEYIKIEKDLFLSTSYDVKMSDGIELEFNSKGEWIEIDCKNKAVPAIFIPNTIVKYMQKNYGGHKIIKIERDRKGSSSLWRMDWKWTSISLEDF